MPIATRDFGDFNIVAERIIRDRIQKKSQSKWWNLIIPKVEEGQIIPNGLSYRYADNECRTRFSVLLRICNIKICLEFYRCKESDCYYDGEKKQNGYDFKFRLSYR